MFHKNAPTSVRSISTVPAVAQLHDSNQSSSPARLFLVSSGSGGTPQTQAASTSFFDLVAVSASRCASFFAEAAVLVLVLALLDRFMLKGRMEMNWVLSAFGISLALLAASIVTEFSARRWLKAH